ncbi:MAG TPA: hypothetical protein PK079_23345 [Leptospiraceae bacterium]|nr:hypothetical protein [Leptospiraceae bacterium]HMW06538.1 hypothetical protein [Leptospiraceae bacterium]HMX35292.1 hypothetical protein [Leptospiraceae bacterium]HMY32824.1 hypothetical protein [Leptospiraceae bacterium]HMZ65319.1 hypothetical protein [Leptospiraceae bacterium]
MNENEVGTIICCLNCVHGTRKKSDPYFVFCNNSSSPARGNWMTIESSCNEFEDKPLKKLATGFILGAFNAPFAGIFFMPKDPVKLFLKLFPGFKFHRGES